MSNAQAVPAARFLFTNEMVQDPYPKFVGTYVASNGIRHGFLQNPDSPTSINVDPPGAAAAIAFGINPDGVIVGQYTAAGKTHAFMPVPLPSTD